MMLSPYALLLLALLCSEVVGVPPGHKKQRGINAQGQLIPVNHAQDPAPATQPSKVYPGQELADITGIPIFAKKRVPLEDLMKLEQEHKFVKKLSSDVWPPKVGGVYFTEPRNYGLPKNYYGTDTPHPVVVMGPADSLKFKDCVLVLDISHNMPLKDEYKTPLRELFPEGTSISGDPGKSDYLTKSFINSAVYRVIQANKFVLVPPVNTELVVMKQDKVERLRESVAKSGYPEHEKFYPYWLSPTSKKKAPQIQLYIHKRMELLKYLLGRT